jgi:plasmid stabilization system protein ParE
MLALRINPLVAEDLRGIKEYISKDNPETAQTVINKLYSQFEIILEFPNIGANLSNRVTFKTDLKYFVLGSYAILYKISSEHVEIYQVVHVAQDLTKIF